MSIARLYVDGEPWEIMGNIVDKFLPYENTIEASRSGAIFPTTEAKPKMLAIDEVKIDITEFADIVSFFEVCATKRFNVTVAIDEDCADGLTEYHYTNALISGTPEFSLFEKKITGFEIAYEQRVIKGS